MIQQRCEANSIARQDSSEKHSAEYYSTENPSAYLSIWDEEPRAQATSVDTILNRTIQFEPRCDWYTAGEYSILGGAGGLRTRTAKMIRKAAIPKTVNKT